jgi:hypothetical protein
MGETVSQSSEFLLLVASPVYNALLSSLETGTVYDTLGTDTGDQSRRRHCIQVEFEVLSGGYEESVFWDIMHCSLLKLNQNFRGICCLHLLCQIGQARP